MLPCTFYLGIAVAYLMRKSLGNQDSHSKIHNQFELPYRSVFKPKVEMREGDGCCEHHATIHGQKISAVSNTSDTSAPQSTTERHHQAEQVTIEAALLQVPQWAAPLPIVFTFQPWLK